MAVRSTKLVTAIALLIVAALIAAVWALMRPPEIPTIPPRDTQSSWLDSREVLVDRSARPEMGYVGSAVCRDCHAEICDSYEMHSMGRATEHVNVAEPIEDLSDHAGFDAPPSSNRPFDVHYYVSRDDERVYHHEQAVAPDGTVIYEQQVPIDYEVGSGVRGRSYFTNRGGILLMSPMTWYSQEERWDFSPGYRNNNLHFERRILDGCIHCHTGQLAPREELLSQFDPERPVLEGAISCERCHGPSEQHVAFQRGNLGDDATDSIVNPARLEPHLRDSVCYQCHFHGVDRILRYGRSEYDFRPGDDIADIWTVFVKDTGVEDNATTEAVSQTEQMLSSRCYQESAGRLGCVSCHDPHSLPTEGERVDFYRSRCLDCHAAGDAPCNLPLDERLAVTEQDSCIECHMPKIAANDVPHTSQTDHRILRLALETTPRPRDNTVTIFRAETGVIPEAELDRAQAIFAVKQAESSGNLSLAHDAVQPLEEWLQLAPDDLAAIEALGIALAIGEQAGAAADVWERGLELNPHHEDMLWRMSMICQENDQIDLAIEYGQRLVEVNPWNHEYWGRLAHALGRRGRLEEGIETAERALEIRPSNIVIRAWLIEAYGLAGNPERAAEHRRLLHYLTGSGPET